MFNRISEWLDVVLETDIPNEVVTFGFHLYKGEHYDWSMELIGAAEFDIDDEDWLCNEATDFNTRDNPLRWQKEAGWEEILNDVVSALKEYLKNGKHADILKTKSGVGVGFVDGNIEIIARQNIEANGDMLDRDFVLFCMPCLSEVQNEMQASQNKMSKAEKRITPLQACSFFIGKKSTDIRKVAAFIIAVVFIMSLFWVLGPIISSHNKTNFEDTPQQTEHFDESTTECMAGDEEQSTSESAPNVEKDSFSKDYLIDKDAGCIYSLLVEMRDGIEIFTRIQAEAVDGTANYVVANTYSMEQLIAEAYGLKYLDNGEDFDFQQVEFTGLYDKNGKTVLCGKASALYNASGKIYSIEWEIDTETIHESAKAYLSDFDIHPLYAAFLLNEISVENPFVPKGYGYDTELTYFDDRVDYDDCFWKKFSLVDVNNDGDPELVFEMHNSPSEVVYILGVQDEKLICYDILITYTTHMAFFVYDNGIVEWGQNYDGEEERYYTFTEDGKEHELIHFIRESDSDSGLYYDYYYLEGNKEVRYNMQRDEEYESLVSSYEGEEPEWFECESFADIPQNQGISESGQIKYQVYIQPDMPEPFIEVLTQYEEFMNADNQNLNDEDVLKKKIRWMENGGIYMMNRGCRHYGAERKVL